MGCGWMDGWEGGREGGMGLGRDGLGVNRQFFVIRITYDFIF